MKTSTVRSLATLLFSTIVTACGSSTDSGSSTEPAGNEPERPGNSSGAGGGAAASSGSGGTTACGPQTCQAGTYCLNMVCVPGCLANTNCASDQSCNKSDGSNVGSCQAKPTQTSLDCNAFCTKSENCDPKGYAAVLGQCAQAKGRTCACADVCLALPSACVTCISSSATCGDANGCKAKCK